MKPVISPTIVKMEKKLRNAPAAEKTAETKKKVNAENALISRRNGYKGRTPRKMSLISKVNQEKPLNYDLKY